MSGGRFADPAKRTGAVRLLSVDGDLARRLSAEERRAAEAELWAPTGSLDPGSWEPPAKAPAGADLGLIVIEGALTREVIVDRGRGVELLGSGDLIRPWQEDSASFCQACWQVLEPTRLAILDERFAEAVARWPGVMTALVERALRRSRWLGVQTALSHLVGVDKRLLTVLWHLAEKWGRIENGTVVIALALTHRLLADMVGARRAYVTEALGELTRSGEISRTSRGFFVLHGEPPVPAVQEARAAVADC